MILAAMDFQHVVRISFEIVALLALIAGFVIIPMRNSRRDAMNHWRQGLKPNATIGDEVSGRVYIDPDEGEIRQLLRKNGIKLDEMLGDELDYGENDDEWVLWFNCGGGMSIELIVRWEDEQWKLFETLDENDGEELFVPWPVLCRYVEESKAMASAHLRRIRQYQPTPN
jgi:hypothetical protein